MLSGLLTGYQASGETEAADLRRMTGLAADAADPWSRSLPLHFTASALVVHPGTRRVLLRWHYKHGLWLQVGGHGDPGETDPLRIALREAAEETGLTDLEPWPDASLRHAAVCHVRASATEPEHEHADLRYILATRNPDAVVPENDKSPLRWLAVDEARDLVGGNNVRHVLDRAGALFAQQPARPLSSGRILGAGAGRPRARRDAVRPRPQRAAGEPARPGLDIVGVRGSSPASGAAPCLRLRGGGRPLS